MAAEKKVLVLCYWNGCVKHGPDGLYYEGTTHRKISVKKKTGFRRFLDGLYLITGFDKQRSKLDLFGRYPVALSPQTFRYVHLPVVDDTSLETMLEVPSNHPSINSVELYLEVRPTSENVINPSACSSPLENSGSSSKRQKTQQPQEANGCADTDVTHPPVKLEKNSSNGSTLGGGGDGKTVDKTSGADEMVQEGDLRGDKSNASKDLNLPGLDVSANTLLNAEVGSRGSKPQCLSSLWIDELELRVGLCFKDRDELKKAVDWCSIRGRQKCVVREAEKEKYTFECIRWKCNWSIQAAKMEEHGFVEITKCSGPHTCCPLEPENFDVEFSAEEIEYLIRVQPTLTVDELGSWWLKRFGYDIEISDMKTAKEEAIAKVYGDWDQSFRLLPKLMAAFQSSNGLIVDWQYDVSPNPEFASFCGVFWSFTQSVEGFRHCRPLIIVDSSDMNGKYPMTLMIASGLDADDDCFPLAFAVTKEVSSDSWRWFLNGIREKVTQRKELCLISAPHPDILAAINEPESKWKEPWAYHRLCLDRLSSQFYDVFQNSRLKSLMKRAGLAMRQDEFDSHMETIKRENPEAWRWLDQIPPHQWALSHDGGRRCGIMTMEMENLLQVCRSFQSPALPVTAATLLLFDELRLYFYNKVRSTRRRLDKGETYAKPVVYTLEELSLASIVYVVCPLDNNAFQVTTRSQNVDWIVHLEKGTCTCGEYQRKKFPCLHALAVCDILKINPLQYVDNFYSLEQLYHTYAATFNPVPEVLAWPEVSGVPTLFPPITIPEPVRTHVSGDGPS